MSCFSCISPKRKDVGKIEDSNGIPSSSSCSVDSSEHGRGKEPLDGKGKDSNSPKRSGARSITFRELATATRNFKATNLIGEGGFGKIVAIKQLDLNGLQGNQEYIVEVLIFFLLSLQSRPFFKDRRKFVQLADPLLQGRFPVRSLHHAIAITVMCLQEQPNFRPLISDVVVALEYLASQHYNPEAHTGGTRSPPPLSPSQRDRSMFSQEPGARKISTSV
ncbi:hypothetical protein HHK36_030824 [Tetracentron sinense]|uniref:Uncharacterized protein n=1 Tax=Tetracentron sinense TaxID=13715 RepID=A0A834YCD7_TETSI|nr:hypothetical protein HHK36_030824 [Tetracentron sinense]